MSDWATVRMSRYGWSRTRATARAHTRIVRIMAGLRRNSACVSYGYFIFGHFLCFFNGHVGNLPRTKLVVANKRLVGRSYQPRMSWVDTFVLYHSSELILNLLPSVKRAVACVWVCVHTGSWYWSHVHIWRWVSRVQSTKKREEPSTTHTKNPATAMTATTIS